MFSPDFIQSVKQRVSCQDVAVALMGQPVKNCGDHVKYCCPVHHEKTPSLAVYSDHFKCYGGGCDFKGDIFSMVQQLQSNSFDDSVEWICETFGISMPTGLIEETLLPKYLEVMSSLADVFHDMNKACGGYELWATRGFSREFVDEYNLGICRSPRKRGTFISYLNDKFGKLPYVDWGIVTAVGDCVFAERLIMPIKDYKGRTFSFVGRTLNGDVRKYLYQKNNEFYNKGSHLFLFDVAKKFDEIVLVEGQMDALSLHAAGIKNSVALGGCDLSDVQKYLLVNKKLVLSLDNDDAGKTATEKILLNNLNKSFKVCCYPSGIKDYNAWLTNGDEPITLYPISDAEFMAMRVKDNAYDYAESFFDYVHKKFNAAKDADVCRFGVNPVGLSNAIAMITDSCDITIDLETILNKIYY